MDYKPEQVVQSLLSKIFNTITAGTYQLSSDVKGYNPHILDHHHPKFIYLERD